MPPFGIKACEQQLKHLGRQRATQLYDWLLETDQGVKGGSQFVGQLQQAVSELQKDLGPFLPQGFDPANLDYTTLARLVSEEIRKQGDGRGRR